ncbi:odorant receptor 13a-like [Aphidius gifuensis]|uniref:odorant receptor 13a-like n=1 Tax=Aphidius gifuensis TaxID=684658 RepID=UPI001CDB665B|nr:odorant receptor 13a-like [Aphidius gifuensis]
MKRQAELQSFKSYSSGIRILLLFMGLWPVENSNVFYKLIPYFLGSVLLIVTSASMNFAIHYHYNLMIALKGVSISLSYLATTVKVICYVIHRKKLMKLEKTLHELLSEQEINKNNDELIKTALTPVFNFRRLSVSLSFCSFSVVTTYFLTPVISMIKQYKNNIRPIKYLLPYPTLYPYAIEGGSLLWIIHFIIETYACFTLFTITASVDTSFAFYSSRVIGQFRVLSNNIRSLKFKRNYEKRIQGYIVHHRKLITCCELLQDIHGPIVLAILLTTALIMCSLTFQISQMETISVKQTILFVVYIAVKLAQTWVYAWSGEMIAAESEDFRKAVYECGWETSDNKTVKHCILFMLMQKPLILQACNYTQISAQLFVAILNTTVSYFFLLQTINDD